MRLLLDDPRVIYRLIRHRVQIRGYIKRVVVRYTGAITNDVVLRNRHQDLVAGKFQTQIPHELYYRLASPSFNVEHVESEHVQHPFGFPVEYTSYRCRSSSITSIRGSSPVIVNIGIELRRIIDRTSRQ